MPPFYQSFLEQGDFEVTNHFGSGGSFGLGVVGQVSSTNSFGLINQDLVSTDTDLGNYPAHSVVDILSFGGGYENVYTDLTPAVAGATDSISDTFYTPFGSFDIPVAFDAAAAAPAAATDWVSALETDWTTLVTDFSALF
jgi:hypothetical protein